MPHAQVANEESAVRLTWSFASVMTSQELVAAAVVLLAPAGWGGGNARNQESLSSLSAKDRTILSRVNVFQPQAYLRCVRASGHLMSFASCRRFSHCENFLPLLLFICKSPPHPAHSWCYLFSNLQLSITYALLLLRPPIALLHTYHG